jgi:hypothetical protein
MDLILAIGSLTTLGGAASYLMTTAGHLERLGHEVTIFALRSGEAVDAARARGLSVVEDATALPERCDGILAQDAESALVVSEVHRHPPLVVVVHGAELDLHLPPAAPEVVSAAVALNARVERRLSALAAPVKVTRLRQPIDTERFRARAPVRERPQKVLLLGNWLRGARHELIAEACRREGLELDRLGLFGRPSPEPELAVAEADVVVGYGRSILEGMSAGRAAYVFDHTGGDGWVTPDNYAALEANGFAGTSSDKMPDLPALRADLMSYGSHMGFANRQLILKHHSAFDHAVELVSLLQSLGVRTPAPGSPLREMARLVRREYEQSVRALEFSREVDLLVRRLVAAEEQIEAIQATRRWRVAGAIARPLDTLRRVAGRERS